MNADHAGSWVIFGLIATACTLIGISGLLDRRHTRIQTAAAAEREAAWNKHVADAIANTEPSTTPVFDAIAEAHAQHAMANWDVEWWLETGGAS